MSTYKWELRSTGRPYGPCEQLDDDDFSRLSRHTTLSAARKAEQAERADMRRICGPNAWNDHYAIFPVGDTPMWADVECPICYAQHRIRYTWHANQRDPLAMERLADDVRVCSACRERRRGMGESARRRDYEQHNPDEIRGQNDY